MARFALAFLGLAILATACSSSRVPPSTGSGDGGATSDMLPVVGSVTKVVYANGAPTNAGDSFTGPSQTGLAPQVVYPADGVIMPPNLSELELQWTPAPGTTMFELHFVSTYLDLTVYTPCAPIGNGCGYLPDEDVWLLMSTQSRGDTMQVTVRAAGAAGVGAAAARKISFTDEDLNGGLYYWAAAAGQIVRYDFGKRNQAAEVFYTPGEAQATCVGCHTLSRNGERIAVGLNAPVPTAGLRVLDIKTKTTLFNGISNFSAFSPDATKVLVNSNAGLSILDLATNALVGADPGIPSANLPDWSADGSKIVYANYTCAVPLFCGQTPGVDGASIFTVDVNGTTFGTPKQVVTGGGNNFYPAFSPDGTMIAFNRSVGNANSFDAQDARVWVVSATGGPPTQLTTSAATGTNVGDSWPKFAPYSHHFKGETIFWLTFASRRDYGLRLVNSAIQPTKDNDPRKSQIWMVGVPASAIQSGAMPAGGYPAFWLPFQSLSSGNHIAQWVEKVVRQGCGGIDGVPCPVGDTCESGQCVGTPIL